MEQDDPPNHRKPSPKPLTAVWSAAMTRPALFRFILIIFAIGVVISALVLEMILPNVLKRELLPFTDIALGEHGEVVYFPITTGRNDGINPQIRIAGVVDKTSNVTALAAVNTEHFVPIDLVILKVIEIEEIARIGSITVIGALRRLFGGDDLASVPADESSGFDGDGRAEAWSSRVSGKS